jgi:lipopolysaccharide heptosyltransferase II
MPVRPLPDAARILIIKTQAIGDVLMTTPAIRDLRFAYPRSRITLLVGNWSAGAVRKSPHLNELITFDDRILLERRPLATLALLARIRARNFDAVFIFHPSPLLHAFAWLAGIPKRYGLVRGSRARFLTAGAPEDLGPDTYYPLNFQRVVALAGVFTGEPSLEVHADIQDRIAVDTLLASAGLGPASPYILMAPGGGRNSKEDVAARRWPAIRFGELARMIRERHPGLTVVLTGGDSDSGETGIVRSIVPESVDLTGKTSLSQLFELASRARVVVCNDSSLLHIAVARGTPAVAPFGPTGARQRLPAWALPYARQSGLACSPCYVGGTFPGCSIGVKCLQEMRSSEMWENLERALADSARAA